MRTTTNYKLNIAEGTDKYNHLTIDNPNYEKIDDTMKSIEDASVPVATELKSGSVHAITRNNPNASMFRFVATSKFTTGDTFTVDSKQVTALLPTGQPLSTGAYVINSNVLCCLVGTNLTIYCPGIPENVDATTLEGHDSSYFASADDLKSVRSAATSAGIVANDANSKADRALAKTAVPKFTKLLDNFNVTINTEASYRVDGLSAYKLFVVEYKGKPESATLATCVFKEEDGYEQFANVDGTLYARIFRCDTPNNNFIVYPPYYASGIGDQKIVPIALYGVSFT